MVAKKSSVKSLIVTLLIAVFVLSVAGIAFGEKIVGVVKDISDKDGVKVYTIEDEKTKESKTVECNDKAGCKVAAGADQAGAKVTVEKGDKETNIRKAVVGC
ncbi:MAG: hypothetical protein L3V56_03360 [Candidatus Magnetoovum sp. WYHC-5]|nr:hypothetical protein [Candidatus Magnetoovum sp. WYHC-5]